MTKDIYYAGLVLDALKQLFNNENDFSIDVEELQEGDNLTDFIHAISNTAPTAFYNDLIGDNKNQLEFNHLANQLCFQYSTKED